MLRSYLLPLTLLALPCLVVVEACGLSEKATTNALTDGTDGGDTTGPGADYKGADVPAVPSPGPSGSPLCGVTSKSCSPDDDGLRTLTSQVQTCTPDGGVTAKPALGDAAIELVPACRIVKNANAQASASTSCELGGDVRGVDGTACKGANDCAPGFDCVDGEKGAVCRRYCCAGTCDGYPAANGGPTFCDVQPVVREAPAPTPDDQVKAPVCMPIKACTLLAPGGCGRKESCAIVTEKGVTGCVSNDERQAGKSCEDKHCAEGLTCLGSPGDRTCYKLCRTTEGADCGPTQTCTTGSTFQDTSFGVCKD